MNTNNLPQWMTAEQVAVLYGVKATTIRQWARDGIIPAHKLGRIWRFNKEEMK